MNMPKGKFWLTMWTTSNQECNFCCFLIGCKWQEDLLLAVKSTNERGVGVMMWSLRHQQLQSWLVFWPVNTWLLPPAIEGSETFSSTLWPELACFWRADLEMGCQKPLAEHCVWEVLCWNPGSHSIKDKCWNMTMEIICQKSMADYCVQKYI